MSNSWLSPSSLPPSFPEPRQFLIESEEQLLDYLPKHCECRVKEFSLLEARRQQSASPRPECSWFWATIRLRLSTSEELLEWIEQFELITNTKWNKSRGPKVLKGDAKNKRLVFKQDLECQHSSTNKVSINSRLDREKAKNHNCDAKLYAKIRRDNEHAKRKDPFYGYFGEVCIKWTHSHSLLSSKTLRFLRNPQLKELFEQQYFSQGIPPAAASEARREYVRNLPGFDPSWLQNQSICPDRRLVYGWYRAWRLRFSPEDLPIAFPHTNKRGRKSTIEKRDALVVKVAEIMTQKLALFSGNADKNEIRSLESYCMQLERAETKEDMVALFTEDRISLKEEAAFENHDLGENVASEIVENGTEPDVINVFEKPLTQATAGGQKRKLTLYTKDYKPKRRPCYCIGYPVENAS